ncbi:hypothetical protein V2J09_021247 [Rumex salicifolius]
MLLTIQELLHYCYLAAELRIVASQNSHLAQLLHEVELIIWDEGIKYESNRKKIFGGITVLLGGDFRLILLVITKGKRQDIVQACINNSPLWKDCKVLKVTQSMRVMEKRIDGTVDTYKQVFNQWILDVDEGKTPPIALEQEAQAT